MMKKLLLAGILGLFATGCSDPQMDYCMEHFEKKGDSHEKAVKKCERAKKIQDGDASVMDDFK
jgi:hypothetical protein